MILPLNDSISLSINDLKAYTKITIGPHVKKDSVNVNGKEILLDENSRFKRVFNVCFLLFLQMLLITYRKLVFISIKSIHLNKTTII